MSLISQFDREPTSDSQPLSITDLLYGLREAISRAYIDIPTHPDIFKNQGLTPDSIDMMDQYVTDLLTDDRITADDANHITLFSGRLGRCYTQIFETCLVAGKDEGIAIYNETGINLNTIANYFMGHAARLETTSSPRTLEHT